MSFLEVRDLHAAYGPVKVLHGVDIDVEQGKVAAVLGPNGAGKTTLLRALSGMVDTRGTVKLDGEDIAGRSTEAVVRKGVAHVPEGRGTFTNLTVEENLRLGAQLRKDRDEIDADVDRMYRYFDVLADRRRQSAGSLSGGEQQMLAVARALMLRPKLLLLDEPSLGLAPMITRDLFEIVTTINAEEGVTVVVVEQNAQLALRMAHTGYVLETGQIAMSGSAEEIRNDDAIAKAYLGV